MKGQDVVADLPDAPIEQPFSRHGQSDWLKSLKRVARAQALAWSRLSIAERQQLLDEVDSEMNRLKGES